MKVRLYACFIVGIYAHQMSTPVDDVISLSREDIATPVVNHHHALLIRWHAAPGNWISLIIE